MRNYRCTTGAQCCESEGDDEDQVRVSDSGGSRRCFSTKFEPFGLDLVDIFLKKMYISKRRVVGCVGLGLGSDKGTILVD